MMKKYTDDELRRIEDSVDRLPEHVKREVFKGPPRMIPKKEMLKSKPVEKKKNDESDTSFLVPPPI